MTTDEPNLLPELKGERDNSMMAKGCAAEGLYAVVSRGQEDMRITLGLILARSDVPLPAEVC